MGYRGGSYSEKLSGEVDRLLLRHKGIVEIEVLCGIPPDRAELRKRIFKLPWARPRRQLGAGSGGG